MLYFRDKKVNKLKIILNNLNSFDAFLISTWINNNLPVTSTLTRFILQFIQRLTCQNHEQQKTLSEAKPRNHYS